MNIRIRNSESGPDKADLVIVLALAGARPETPSGLRLDAKSLAGFKGEWKDQRFLDTKQGRYLVIGLGERADLDVERLRRVGGLCAKSAESDGVARAALWVGGKVEKAVGGGEPAGRALVEGVRLGSYRYRAMKSKPKRASLKSFDLHGGGRDFARGAERGRVLAEAAAFTRDLQNAPGNRMRPRDLAAAARKLATGSPQVTCKVLDEAAMKRLGMGALLGVSAGSVEPAYLIHLTYKPKGRSRGKLAFVGKGLTFDAGGISLKPAAKMWDMKYDMSGGAAVLGAFHALCELDVPYEVHGVVPTSENLPDAAATKPGDVHKAMNGTTIEVLNTDAEGRLILADALSYTATKIRPEVTIDLATLTGAVVVALGHEFSGVFTESTALRDGLVAAGRTVGEEVWPMPLTKFHREWMRSEVADLKNIHSPDQGAGSSAAAGFLAHFAGEGEWAHLDIAGAAWGGMNREWTGGSSGSGVGARLLVQYVLDRAQTPARSKR